MKLTGIETIQFNSRHHNANRNWLLIKLLTDDPDVFGIGEASPLGLDNQVDSILKWFTGHGCTRERYLAAVA